MMEVVLTRLRDFSRKTATFDHCQPVAQGACRAPQTRPDPPRAGMDGKGSPCKLDIQSALAWLRKELMEMRSQDQALVRQLMELHTGIQELKQELSEEEEDAEEEVEEGGEESSCWDSESERWSGSFYFHSADAGFSVSCLKTPLLPPLPPPLPPPPPPPGSSGRRGFSRRSSVP